MGTFDFLCTFKRGYLGLYWVYIGIMEKWKLLYYSRVYIRVIVPFLDRIGDMWRSYNNIPKAIDKSTSGGPYLQRD